MKVMIMLCLLLFTCACKSDYEFNIEGQKTKRNYQLKKTGDQRQINITNKETH